MNISINPKTFPKKVFLTLLLIEIILIFLDFLMNYSGFIEIKQIRRIFNIARETSIPTWFSSIQLFIVGCMAWLISINKGKSSTKISMLWSLIGGFFIFLSIDEASKIHERIGHVFKHHFLESKELASLSFANFLLDTFPSWGWHLIITPIYIAIGLLIILFILKELKDKKLILVIFIGLSLYAGAIIIDYFEGIEGFFGMVQELIHWKKYTVNHYFKVIEEFFEMLGTSCILYGLISYFLTLCKGITIQISAKKL